MPLRRRYDWRALVLVGGWFLWIAWVWYANYLQCDDRLRDQGIRFEAWRLERCTLPQWPFEIHELFWFLGTAVLVLGLSVLRRRD